MSAVPVVAGVACRDASAAAYDCLEKNFLPEDPLGVRRAPLPCSSFIWLQPRYDAGWCFSPSARLQLQQLRVDAIFFF
jgi:hypothetical protein